MDKSKQLIILVGPTGIGKTDMSIEVAKYFDTEIISCDSRQMFREMNIGTAVPSPSQLEAVSHHFIGNLSIHDYYNVFSYETDVLKLLEKLFEEKDHVVLAGGSGLYLDAVLFGMDDIPDPDPILREKLTKRIEAEGVAPLAEELRIIDPEYYSEVDHNNPKRVLRGLEVWHSTGKKFSSFRIRKNRSRPFTPQIINLEMDRELLYKRINRRVNLMLEMGMKQEAISLYPQRALNALNTVGYKEWFGHFDGLYPEEEALRLIKRNTRRYAKRQITWNKKYDIKLNTAPVFSTEIKDFLDQLL